MNKKLFSWKALAGFALLAAISMTSCTNTDDPINPLDPNPSVKPTVVFGDEYDLTFNITKNSDVKDLWDKVPAATKGKLALKDSITVGYNVSNYSIDGNPILIPNFFSGSTAKKVLNVTFAGTFASQVNALGVLQYFDVDLDTNLDGAEVNLFMYSDVSLMKLLATKERVTMGGAALVGELQAWANQGPTHKLGIVSDLIIGAIDLQAGSLKDLDQIVSKLVTADETLDKDKKGAKVGNVTNEILYAKSLTIKNSAKVSNIDAVAMDTIYVAAKQTVTFGNKVPNVKGLIGLGKKCKAEFVGDADGADLSKIKSVKNIELVSNTETDIDDFGIFENTVFSMPVNFNQPDSIYATTFNKSVRITINDDEAGKLITFNGVDFGQSASFTVSSELESIIPADADIFVLKEINPSNKTYADVKDLDPENLSKANAKYWPTKAAQLVQKTYTKKQYDNLVKNDSIYFDGKKYWVTAGSAKVKTTTYTFPAKYNVMIDTYNAAKKAYDDLYDKNTASGEDVYWGARNANASPEYTAYKNAYAALYGNAVDMNNMSWNWGAPAQEIYEKDGVTIKGYDFNKANFTYKNYNTTTKTFSDTPAEYYTSPYALTANMRAFTDAANSKLSSSPYILAIYYSEDDVTKYVDPTPILINYESCNNYQDKALTKTNLKKMFGTVNFGSAEEAWFYVSLDDEVLPWKHVTGSEGKFILNDK